MAKDIPALLEAAAAHGFTLNFEAREQDVYCPTTGRAYGDGAITLMETIHKDAGTDPGDEATLFLLQAEDGDRGVLLIGNPMSLSATERTILDRLNQT